MIRRPYVHRILVALLIALFCAPLGAQQSWEGLATVGRFGRFPIGLYGASNLVAAGSIVTVENLETGNSAQVAITAGVDEPGLFLVLSPEAAAILSVTGDGAPRVRLTAVAVSDVLAVDPLDERAFHPDPDINPLAAESGSRDALLSSIPPGEAPSLLDEQVEVAQVAVPPVIELNVTTPVDVDVVITQEDLDVTEPDDATTVGDLPQTDEAVPSEDEPRVDDAASELPETTPAEEPVTETVSPDEAQPEDLTPDKPTPDTGPRTGIAAGIARTSVGQAQETFERPDAALDVSRPEETSVGTPVTSEPEVAPDESASTSIETVTPEEIPPPDTTDVEPQIPEEQETPEERAPEVVEGPVDDQLVDAPLAEEPLVEEQVEPDPVVETVPAMAGPSPIEDAVSAAASRLPRKDLFPPPSGDDGDFGFSPASRPADGEVAVANLPEVDVPAMERPALAGLAPLQAAPSDLEFTVVEAVAPAADVPELASVGPRSAPDGRLRVSSLPEAVAGAEERPIAEGVGPVPPPSATPVSGELAEATPAQEERPDIAALGPVSPPVEDPAAARLAEAGVADEERPNEESVGPATAPGTTPVAVELAEAEAEPEETPDESLMAIEPEPGEAVGVAAAEPAIDDEVEPVVDIASLEEPEGDVETLLSLEPADFRPPEVPDPDAESHIDREAPDEEPEVEVVLDSPEPADETSEESIEIVEATAEEPADEPEIAVEVAVAVTEPPPTVADTTVPAAIEELPVVATLADESYYLQVGAYTSAMTARVTVDALSTAYPMTVLPLEEPGRVVYRVLVGPLEEDETGTLLFFLRAKGYADTFVRSGTEL